MKTEIKTALYRCDICQKENITPQTVIHTKATGYAVPGGEQVGIEITVRAYGSYREHICFPCARDAVIEAAKALSGMDNHA